jgi:squalene-associated FAD-dependent desaturase
MTVDLGATVVVVGGGLAGLAATAALAQRGFRVTLIEPRPRLGGRASSFVDQTTGELIDNCQHVNLGCCTNFRHFCKTVGIADRLRRERELYFIGSSGRVCTFRADRWPAPFHLLRSFRRLDYLDARDLRAIASGLRQLAKPIHAAETGESFADWLRSHGQTPQAIGRFWHVVLVSALSESLDRIAVPHARKVFVDAFLSHRDGWQVEVPDVPLSEFYGTALTDWLTSHGVMVRLLEGVRRVVEQDGRAMAVELRGGELLTADQFVLAVPQHRLLDLLSETWAGQPFFRRASEIETAPISSLHLWFDRPITDLPHAVLVDRTSQWLFNRTALHTAEANGHSRPTTSAFYYQVVISASRDLAGREQEDVRDEVVRELRAIWPETDAAHLVHWRLVTERRAVFSVTPGTEALRPPQQTPIPNLHLAGDWTQTGWPATMEGAVRSGYLAAESVLNSIGGTAERLVQPDLPTSTLARWLFGLPKV